jgi:hypothetical protein
MVIPFRSIHTLRGGSDSVEGPKLGERASATKLPVSVGEVLRKVKHAHTSIFPSKRAPTEVGASHQECRTPSEGRGPYGQGVEAAEAVTVRKSSTQTTVL